MILANQTQLKSLAIADLPTGGNIGTAATTVDIGSAFSINQITASQTLSLPNPTVATDPREVTVINVGAVTFTMHSISIASGAVGFFVWTASSWSAASAGPTIIPPWAATTAYVANQPVTQGTRTIKRIATGTSGATFTNAEAALWTLVSSTGTPTFAGTTYYYAGEQVKLNQKIVQRVTSGISAGTFSNAESSNWTLVTYTPSTWLGATYYYVNEVVYSPIAQNLILGIGGFTTATFDAAEVASLAWIVKTASGNAKAFVASTYYFAGDIVTNTDGTVYRCKTGHFSAATMTVAELTNWIIAENEPSTSVSTTYSVVETDDMIDIVSGATFTITIPASRVNPIIKFSTGSLGATPPTIATAGGETIINPSTYASVTSFTMPGTTGLASSVQFQKVGTQYRFVA